MRNKPGKSDQSKASIPKPETITGVSIFYFFAENNLFDVTSGKVPSKEFQSKMELILTNVMQLMVKPTNQQDTMETSTSLTTREKFSQLMREHHRELLVYARAIVKDHHAAQDIVQDSLISAYRKFATFDEDLDFGKWMRGIIRHKCLDWFRKRKRTPIPDTEIVDIELDIAAWQAAREVGKPPLFEALEQCIGQLPEKLKSAVTTFYLQENSGAETADKLEVSAATVRKRLERARDQLHNCLAGKSEPGNIQPIS
jgi:RNA polymerase sigma-70 factor (ECF subfamily)